MRHLAWVGCVLLLTGCAGSALLEDVDPARDFSRYHSWSWATPGVQYLPDDPAVKNAITEQRLGNAVAAELSLHGLQPAAANAKGDLLVRLYLITTQRLRPPPPVWVIWTPGPWGPGPWGPGPWGAPPGPWGGDGYGVVAPPAPPSVELQRVLRVELFDGPSGQAVWSASQPVDVDEPGPPAQRYIRLAKAVHAILALYPKG